jgi:hypothetical protein
MKLIAEPYRPSQHVKTLPTIPENEVVVFANPNFRRFARENQILSMRAPFVNTNLVRVSAHHDLARLGSSLSLNQQPLYTERQRN